MALIGLVIAAFTLPIVDWLAAFFAWVQANPAIAWAVFIAFYVGAVVLMLPGSIQNGRMLKQQVFDFDAGDIFSTRNDDVLRAIFDLYVTVFSPYRQIAGMKPAACK